LKLTDVSEVRTVSIIALIMEAVRKSEMLVHFNVATRRYIPEGFKFVQICNIIRWPLSYKEDSL
jgi:hypothetical protein